MRKITIRFCPHQLRKQVIFELQISQTHILCDSCYEKIMLLLSSKRVMDEFYIRQLPLEHQYKIRREKAQIYIGQ